MTVNDQDQSTGPVAEPFGDDPNYRDDWDGRPAGRSAGPRPRKADGASIVYSIRLGPEEVAELQRRAEVVSLPPTMLARQFIRAGLHAQDDVDGEDETVSALSDRLVRDSAALYRILSAGAR